MPERWIKEAEDLRPAGSAGVMARNHSGVKVTWHVTVSPSGGSMFTAMHGVLTRNKSEPNLLWDPLTDRLGQYFPLDTAGRALGNDGNRPTNRDGTVNIQIEVVAMPDGFTRYWKPGPNYRAMMRAIRSWGIPDVWPAGPVAPSGRADQQVSRSWSHYVKSGHFGHCNVPGNDHWDPGPIDQRAIFTATTGSSAPATHTLPAQEEQEWRPTGRLTTKDVQELVGVTADGDYGPATTKAVAALQQYIGTTPDGLWGPETERIVSTLQDDINTLTKKVDIVAAKTDQVPANVWRERFARPVNDGREGTVSAATFLRYRASGADVRALAAEMRALAAVDTSDPAEIGKAIADSIRADVVAAIQDAGSSAVAEDVVELLAQRLAGTE